MSTIATGTFSLRADFRRGGVVAAGMRDDQARRRPRPVRAASGARRRSRGSRRRSTSTPVVSAAALAASMPCWFQPKSVPCSGVRMAMDCRPRRRSPPGRQKPISATALTLIKTDLFDIMLSLGFTIASVLLRINSAPRAFETLPLVRKSSSRSAPLVMHMRTPRMLLPWQFAAVRRRSPCRARSAARATGRARHRRPRRRFPSTRRNEGPVPIACGASLAHWYSLDLGEAGPGETVAATLWFDPSNGETFLLNASRGPDAGEVALVRHRRAQLGDAQRGGHSTRRAGRGAGADQARLRGRRATGSSAAETGRTAAEPLMRPPLQRLAHGDEAARRAPPAAPRSASGV